LAEDPGEVFRCEAAAAIRGRRGDHAIELFDVPEAAERVRHAAAFLDPRVDGNAAAERRVFDGFEQRRCDRDVVALIGVPRRN